MYAFQNSILNTCTVQNNNANRAQPEEYVTSSVLWQGVFDAPSLTLVIGANIFKQILNTTLQDVCMCIWCKPRTKLRESSPLNRALTSKRGRPRFESPFLESCEDMC
jgi:hypothetical protein